MASFCEDVQIIQTTSKAFPTTGWTLFTSLFVPAKTSRNLADDGMGNSVGENAK